MQGWRSISSIFRGRGRRGRPRGSGGRRVVAREQPAQSRQPSERQLALVGQIRRQRVHSSEEEESEEEGIRRGGRRRRLNPRFISPATLSESQGLNLPTTASAPEDFADLEDSSSSEGSGGGDTDPEEEEQQSSHQGTGEEPAEEQWAVEEYAQMGTRGRGRHGARGRGSRGRAGRAIMGGRGGGAGADQGAAADAGEGGAAQQGGVRGRGRGRPTHHNSFRLGADEEIPTGGRFTSRLGSMSEVCPHCNAKMWREERVRFERFNFAFASAEGSMDV